MPTFPPPLCAALLLIAFPLALGSATAVPAAASPAPVAAPADVVFLVLEDVDGFFLVRGEGTPAPEPEKEDEGECHKAADAANDATYIG